MSASPPTEPVREAQAPESMWTVARRSRPFLLLMALALNLVLVPVVGRPWLRLLIQAAIILAAASLAADTPAHRRVTALLAAPGLILIIIADLTGSRVVEWTAFLFLLGLFVHVIRLMLGQIFAARRVTIDEIGLALCTYVLLGQLWVLFYVPVVALQPDAFAFNTQTTTANLTQTLTYFSYVTLTTLGYGDIQPLSPLARGLAVVEALTGVLFLAVLISRLVGRYGSQRD
jgi:voltage-gated potassium channel